MHHIGRWSLACLASAALMATVPASAHASAVRNGHSEPEIFAPGVISTAAEEYRIAFEPDGRTAYFGRGQDFFPISRQSTIMVSKRSGAGWGTAEPASFSGTYADLDPFITADGNRLFFSSIRPVSGAERSDVDLWMVRRGPGGQWGQPVNLGAVNSGYDELYPSVAADGTLYFASDRPGGLGGFDIYRSRPQPDGRYGPAENLGAPVNTEIWEFNPVILPGNVLIFTGLNRPGGNGSGDQWVSVRLGNRWTTPRTLGPAINTAADEYHLSFSPSYDRAYFVRHTYDPWVAGDIYTLPTWRLLLP